jgi:hypothetical protein
LAEAYGRQRLPPLDVVREGSQHLCDELPGRFPVTLYKEQWLRLLAMAEDIKAFIEANNDHLRSKE